MFVSESLLNEKSLLQAEKIIDKLSKPFMPNVCVRFYTKWVTPSRQEHYWQIE